MVDVLLTIISAVLFVVVFGACVYFLAHYQHPDEINAALFPKVIVVLGLSLSIINILLLPLDVSARNSPYGGVPTDMLWLVTQLLLGTLVLFVVPFAYVYYTYSEANMPRTKARRYGLVTVVVLFLVYSAVTVVTYFFLGITQIPVTAHSVTLVSASRPAVAGPCTECATTVEQTVQEFKVSFVVYMLGPLSLVGWLCLAVFGGLGLMSVSFELIQAFIYRPRPIDKRTWDRIRVDIGERAARLIIQGRSFQKESPTCKVLNKYRIKVYLLQEEFNEAKLSYERRGGSRIVPVLRLIAGILGYGLTLVWILQIVLWNAFGVWPFLNGLFIALDGVVVFFGVVFYSVFAYWLLVCTVCGNFKFALRVPFIFAIHPVKVGQTYLSAFLYNVELIMLTSLSLSHFLNTSFSVYARLTASNVIFNLILGYLRVWQWIWYALTWLLIAVAVTSFIFLLIRPRDSPNHYRWRQRQSKHRHVELQTLHSQRN
jgi:LMBR1 domain-containing protein 1